MELLIEPLTEEQMKKRAGDDKYISGIVPVSLSDVISLNLEGFIDLLSRKLTGSELLMDVSWNVVGHSEDTLHIEVTGDVSETVY